MRISLNVAVAKWRAPDFDVVLAGGKHELPSDEVKLSKGLVRAIAAAAGAGVVEILEADAPAARLIDGAVESDEDSLKTYEASVKSGVWLEGHLEDVIAQRERESAELLEQLREEGLDEAEEAELAGRADWNDLLLSDARARLAAHRGEA